MKRNSFIFCLLFILFISIGCSSSYTMCPTLVRWNDVNYTTTNILIEKEDIGEQLNTVKKTVKKFPKENCEANNNIEVGTKLFRIKNENITEAIAIEIKGGKYLKAIDEKIYIKDSK